VLRKKVAMLVAAAVMVLSMLVVSAPAFAQELGPGAADPNPGQTEASDSWHTTPPGAKPGSTVRNPTANEKNPDVSTGRGELIEG
jgi:hypothetical protein